MARLGIGDLDFARADAVSRLRSLLVEAVAVERRQLVAGSPVVIVHSGDVEAFGVARQTTDFTGFAYLRDLFADAAADGVVAVYGNHDVWPGTVPLFDRRRPRQDRQKQTIAENAEIVGELPPAAPIRFQTGHDIGIAFVPLSTVLSSALRGGILANGRLSPHPPTATDVIGQLRRLQLRASDLNVAVMHHPPHFYRPITWRDRAGIGRLERSTAITDELRSLGINLVLSGHRHRLDPPYGHTLDTLAGHQPPLSPGMAQLVALSPTVETESTAHRADPTGTPSKGLCVYRVIAGRDEGAVSIQRVIHRADEPKNPRSTFEPNLIRHLELAHSSTQGPVHG